MEKKPPRPMTPFDEWTVPDELHTLKLLLPYTPAASQPALGMLIKVIELQHTMDFFQQKKNHIHSQDFSGSFSSPLDMLEEISPYLPPKEADMVSTFRNMMHIMDMVQMMQASSGAGEDVPSTPDGPGSGFNPMGMVMGMLSPEQQEMFEMYQDMFSQPESSMDTSAGSSDNNPENAGFDTQDDHENPDQERNDPDYE